MDWLSILASFLLASLLLLFIFKFSHSIFKNKKEHNSLDSKQTGKTILITGSIKSGKTFLFQKLINTKKPLQTVHSLESNVFQFGKWKLIDLFLDTRKLHSQPANFFHFNDLAALILCSNKNNFNSTEDWELLITMTFAVGTFKKIPICINIIEGEEEIENNPIIIKDLFLKKLFKTLQSIQHTRLASLLNQENDSSLLAISFDDPINRLIFESSEGEVADFESSLRSYFNEYVTITNNVQKWINDTL